MRYDELIFFISHYFFYKQLKRKYQTSDISDIIKFHETDSIPKYDTKYAGFVFKFIKLGG